jgi:hypothetical protein
VAGPAHGYRRGRHPPRQRHTGHQPGALVPPARVRRPGAYRGGAAGTRGRAGRLGAGRSGRAGRG